MSATLQPVSMKKGRGWAPRLSEPYDPNKERHERFWSDAEIAIVRSEFPTGGAAACQVKLPNRTISSIYGLAHKLKLRAPGRKRPRQHHELTPEIERRMREAWPELIGRGAITRFVEVDLAVPKHIGLRWAVQLGLARLQRKEPRWTAAEDALMGKVPLHSPDMAARIFREHGFPRTPTAIVIRAKRLGLSRRYSENLSGTAAAKIIGMDNKTVTAWCVAGELRASRRPDRRLPQQGGSSWDITRADLRQFVIDNIARIDIRKVDKVAFVDLLVSTGLG
jgi:hypothetical protein